jgi:hypothetical protein
MTYAELLNLLYQMPKDRLEDTVTIKDVTQDEYYGVTGFEIAKDENNDVLDEGHLFLKIAI